MDQADDAKLLARAKQVLSDVSDAESLRLYKMHLEYLLLLGDLTTPRERGLLPDLEHPQLQAMPPAEEFAQNMAKVISCFRHPNEPEKRVWTPEPKPVCGNCSGRGCVVESVYGFTTTKEPCPCSAPAEFSEGEIQAAKKTADNFESGGSFRGLIQRTPAAPHSYSSASLRTIDQQLDRFREMLVSRAVVLAAYKNSFVSLDGHQHVAIESSHIETVGRLMETALGNAVVVPPQNTTPTTGEADV